MINSGNHPEMGRKECGAGALEIYPGRGTRCAADYLASFLYNSRYFSLERR